MKNKTVQRWVDEYGGTQSPSPYKDEARQHRLAVENIKDIKGTPQSQPIPGAEDRMIFNSAGGMAFEVSDWTRLDRFLIIGTEGGTFYASQRTLTKDGANAILRLLGGDEPMRVIDRIVEISESRRGLKNDTCMFALALAAINADESVRSYALHNAHRVLRTGGDFLRFVSMLKSMRGMGNTVNNMMRHWYQDKSPEDLAYQVAKYQKRGGMSHRDALRLSHPNPHDGAHDAIYGWIVKGMDGMDEHKHGDLPGPIRGFEIIKATEDPNVIARVLRDFNLTWEFVPSEKRTPEVWTALVDLMPMRALIRWLPTMTEMGILERGMHAHASVVNHLTDAHAVHASKVHPIHFLIARHVYMGGVGIRSKKTWSPVQEIVSALESAFYASFGNIAPTGKRHLIALDVSGSMDIVISREGDYGNLTVREASVAMMMSLLRSEENVTVVAFSGGGEDPANFESPRRSHWLHTGDISLLPFAKDVTLDRAIWHTSQLRFSGTDCSLPMLYATERNIPVDVFSIWTDNETWAGAMHPMQALDRYREKMGIPAKLVVCAMTATDVSIADPKDPGTLDVVGFDASIPNLIAEFSTGNF